MGLGGDQARASAAIATAQSTEGTVSGLDFANGLVTVNLQGAPQVMTWIGAAPWVGDRVRVIKIDGLPFAIPKYGAALGTVQTVASGLATILGDDGVVYPGYSYQNGTSPAVGWRVALDHKSKSLMIRLSAEPAGSTFEAPSAPPSSGVQSATFYPTQSGNFRNGTFAGEYAEISQSRTAAYYYGAAIATTIPDGATILRAEISLLELWDEVPGTPTQMGLHTHLAVGAEPTISGTINVSATGTYALGGFADSLKTGAAYGIGFRKNTGWRRFGDKTNSGAIFMEWSA